MSATLKSIRTTRLFKKQDDIARSLGISQEHYSNIETGRAKPGLELVPRMAFVFGISTDAVLKAVGRKATQ